MSLNKLLCKYFDEDHTGEVTVKGVIDGMFWMVAPIIVVAMYIHGAISMYKTIYTPNYIPPSELFFILGMGMFLLVSGIVMLEGLSYIIPRILGARIAKCARKDGDETDGST